MTVGGRLLTPGTESALGDHEARIRALERSPGGGDAVFLEALWAGTVAPLNAGPAGGVWQVPYLNGVGVTFDLTRAYFRLESASTAGSYEVEIQWSPPGGIFVAHTICDLTLGPGVNEAFTTTALGTVASGDLLRVVWLLVGANGLVFTVQLEGVQAP